MKVRRTELYPWAWFAHHRLQWGQNFKHVFGWYIPQRPTKDKDKK